MLTLRMNDEDWREALDSHGLPSDAIEVESLRSKVLRSLKCDYGRCYTQSVGAFVIAQSGTPEEMVEFCAALETEIAALKVEIV